MIPLGPGDSPKRAGRQGEALIRRELYTQAVEHYRLALRRYPDNARLYYGIGFALRRLRQWEASAAACRRSVALRGKVPHYRVNLHFALQALGLYEEDERQLREGLQKGVYSTPLIASLGSSLLHQGRLDQAMKCLNRALKEDPDNVSVRLDRSKANFLAGRYREGWADYAWRRQSRIWYGPKGFTGRDWKGQDLDGQSLLLYGEQG